MKFIDEVQIEVQAGKGGAGCCSFRREKFVPYGGPDGGNGGKGASVILVADRNKHTLLDFRYKPHWKAENGTPGEGTLKDGKDGKNLYIRVPVGTQVLSCQGDEKLVVDLTEDQQEFVLTRGGIGGKGNTFFKSSTNQAPRHAQPGKPGEQGSFLLSLKLIADVALVGLPNAGKSTLISRISAARPKIADYPFTTLQPCLGVVAVGKEFSIVVADIPGLISGAHTGKGLGIKFLKHIERTRLLLHLIDISDILDDHDDSDPLKRFEQINTELKAFSEELSQKEQIVILSKIDAVSDKENLRQIRASFEENSLECLAISSSSGEGLEDLKKLLARKLSNQEE